MKLLFALIFLVVYALYLWTSIRVYNKTLDALGKKRFRLLGVTLNSLVLFGLTFVGYSVLAGASFSYQFFLLLSLLSIVAHAISYFLTVLAGISAEEIRAKVKLLNIFVGVKETLENPRRSRFNEIVAVIILLPWLAALILYIVFPKGSVVAQAWLVIVLFVIPHVLGMLYTFNYMLPIVTSQSIDDDVRNYYLCNSLAMLFSTIIYFAYPVYILKTVDLQIFNWIPPFWVIVSILVILHFLLAIIPFFIGVYGYKSHQKAFLQYYSEMLEECRHIILVPVAPANLRMSLDMKIVELDSEIRERRKSSKVESVMAVMKGKELADRIDKRTIPLVAEIVANEGNILRWNNECVEIEKLTKLREGLLTNDFKTIAAFLEILIKDANEKLAGLKKRKNVLVGIITGILTVAIPFLLKTFHEDIGELARAAMNVLEK